MQISTSCSSSTISKRSHTGLTGSTTARLGDGGTVDAHVDLVRVEGDVRGGGQSFRQRVGQAPRRVGDPGALHVEVPVLPVTLVRALRHRVAAGQQLEADVVE